MTREKAIQVDKLLHKIEAYEALLDEIYSLDTLYEINVAYGDDLEPEFDAIIKTRLDNLLKELEEM
jgi:hypothetical protein